MMVTFDPRDKYQGQLSPRLTIKVLDPTSTLVSGFKNMWVQQ